VKCVVVDSVCQRMNSTIKPTPMPIANPPHKNASICSIGRGLLSIITVKPIQIGSKLNSDCDYHYRGQKDGDGTRHAPRYTQQSVLREAKFGLVNARDVSKRPSGRTEPAGTARRTPLVLPCRLW
jgi:hypothetical protein